MKKCLLICLMFALPLLVCAQEINMIPYPNKVNVLQGHLLINKDTRFYADKGRFADMVSYFNGEFGGTKKSALNKQQLVSIAIDRGNRKPGSYKLSITLKTININGVDSAGVFNGMVTLLQLCKLAKGEGQNLALPCIIINDEPKYQWRGFLLDESRHFFGKMAVERILNWMAFYKLNRFHWHLTDAQGWRFSVSKYPLLATKAGIGNFTDSLAAAQYYTQADVREIVNYAKQRSIEIIPEIDMPGHATAANKAYPVFSGGTTSGFENFTFNPGKEITYQFMGDVLREVKSLFPGNRIHIGGDEVTLGIKAWENNPDVNRLMKENNFTDHRQAEFYFLKRIADTVSKLNCKVMCWDEAVAAGLPVSQVTINWWRQDKPAVLNEALDKGYHVILCPRLPLYFDFVQDSTHRSGRKWGKRYNSYLDVYHFPENTLTNAIYSNSNVIGVQANLWTETVITEKRLQYLLFPRLAALAESGWNDSSVKNDDLFNKRLKAHLVYYKKTGIYYYDPFNPGYHPEVIDEPKPAGNQD
ncbi:beta-N-acetylhexosaminidase [Mucilaginibacter sp. SP1R1]|uniref:beta-N-acetylhexosaminidase n=1 Tax=Mucilaginibacter sp. SP1R1 TaxID=2723091 RepID=UPI0016209090|nr:beta-N-acetylhexosaminidase [Mucilaginibacter sp. SP1R1]MBB6149957.1 hexosaminidase [Mucilaginibacter sp. SP1R1]